MKPPFDLAKFRAALRSANKPGQGFFDEDRLATLPYRVEQYGLGRDQLAELEERRDLCATLPGDFYVEPRSEQGQLVGRVFHFESNASATFFKLRFHGEPYGDWPQ